mmetsp:Transcript_51009/g.122054  ORF Transcript_51009/g.122054 Transcript_51009/m.122054 type:complete len:214 (-) Transcript_51009:28-669(-)
MVSEGTCGCQAPRRVRSCDPLIWGDRTSCCQHSPELLRRRVLDVVVRGQVLCNALVLAHAAAVTAVRDDDAGWSDAGRSGTRARRPKWQPCRLLQQLRLQERFQERSLQAAFCKVPGLRQLRREVPANKGCAYLSALAMAIHDTVQGHTLRAQAHAEGDAHVLHDEVGVLLLDIFGKAPVLELGNAAGGKILTWHRFLWCHGPIISPAQRGGH